MAISKYQTTIRKSWEETESGRIALMVNDSHMEFRSGQRLKAIDSNITVESSDDGLVLYIWKPVEDKPNRNWYKIIPNCGYSVEQLVKCLDAQPWNYL